MLTSWEMKKLRGALGGGMPEIALYGHVNYGKAERPGTLILL
jgi:hypothetical protein